MTLDYRSCSRHRCFRSDSLEEEVIGCRYFCTANSGWGLSCEAKYRTILLCRSRCRLHCLPCSQTCTKSSQSNPDISCHRRPPSSLTARCCRLSRGLRIVVCEGDVVLRFGLRMSTVARTHYIYQTSNWTPSWYRL